MSEVSDSKENVVDKDTLCPKCGGKMIRGRCEDCNFSYDTAISHEEAREATAAG